MKISQGAVRSTLGQVLLQPLSLLGGSIAATNLIALTVERDDVPRAHFVTVKTLRWIAGSLAEIARVARGAAAAVFVVPWRWPGAIFKASPRSAVTCLELLVGTVRISQVTDSKNRARDFFDQLGSGLCAHQIIAGRDVAGAHQHRVFRGGSTL